MKCVQAAHCELAHENESNVASTNIKVMAERELCWGSRESDMHA